MKIYKPQEALRPYIAMYYLIEGGALPNGETFNEYSLPSGHTFMVFQHLGQFKIHNNSTKKILELPEMYATGQQVSSCTLLCDENSFEAFVVCLKPTAFWHLTKKDVSTLVDEVVPLNELWKYEHRYFNPLLDFNLNINERIKIFEDILLQFLGCKKFSPNIIDLAVEEILEKKGCIRIKNLTAKFNVSIRYFRKQFKETVGIPPSTYTRITRFNFLFSEMNSVNKNDFYALSSFFGYYDISHFSKDFKKYCGDSPRNFHIEKFKFFKDVWIDDPLILKAD